MENVDKNEGVLHHCYGCGPMNPIGLKLEVRQEGESAVAEYIPGENHEGWPGVVHGGVTCALLDEIMGYVPYFLHLRTVTGKLNVEFRSPLRAHERIYLKAVPLRITKRMIAVKGTVHDEHHQLLASANADMVILNERQLKEVGILL